MNAEDYNKALLAITMWREARGEGPDGMRGVGHVVANRVKAWGGGWCHAITFPLQFSSMTVLGDTQTIIWPSDTEALLFGLAEAIYSGKDADNTFGALYYANESNIASKWYSEHVINSGKDPIVALIGHQTFRK